MTHAIPAPTLLHVFSTFAVGGPQVRFAALANYFKHDFTHAIVAMDGAYAAKALLDESSNAVYPKVDIVKGATLGNVRRFRSTLRHLRPSALVTYNWGSIEWAMANWPGIVRHIHIEDGFGTEEATHQLARRVLTRRWMLSRSTVVFPSYTIQRIARDVWKLDPARLRLIPNGIDCAKFTVERQPPTSWPPAGPVIGTVAGLRREKNLGRLLEAFQKVRQRMPCRLLIAGDGLERHSLQAHAITLGIESDVTFCGYVQDTERIYRDMDLFALSSDTEQMPTVVLEAMAASLAVASTDVGDVRTMLATENRAYLAERDSGALAEVIIRLLENPALCWRLGKANCDIARTTFDQRAMFDSYRALFSAEP